MNASTTKNVTTTCFRGHEALIAYHIIYVAIRTLSRARIADHSSNTSVEAFVEIDVGGDVANPLTGRIWASHTLQKGIVGHVDWKRLAFAAIVAITRTGDAIAITHTTLSLISRVWDGSTIV